MSTPVSLSGTQRIWLEPALPPVAGRPETRLFRRSFQLDAAPANAELFLFAELRYQLWVNGQYVGRGPIQHHPTTLPFDRHDLSTLLRTGTNLIAVLVHTPSMALHNAVPLGDPGLIAQLHVDGKRTLQSDRNWRVSAQTGWSSDSPKRSWALGPIEQFEMASAPLGWTEIAFDDSAWPLAQEHPIRPDVETAVNPLPPLKYEHRHPTQPPKLLEIDDAPVAISRTSSSGALADSIMRATWKEPAHLRLTGSLADANLTIEGLSPEHGAILCLDVGREYAGQVTLDCDCPGSGTIDIGWSELTLDGRPQLSRKGVSYVDRVLATAGRLNWHPIGINAARYVVLVFRGFSGPVRIRRVSVLASECALSWTGDFNCGDERLNQVWELCRYTLRAGTQEGLMDCPSREQSAYVGDGHPVAKWTAQITGDTRHWKYLVTEQFQRQAADGMMRSAVYSGRSDTLIDYSIIGVMGTRDYYNYTGDLETVRKVLPNCRRVLAWFDSRRDADGFFLSNWQPPKNAGHWEYPYDPSEPSFHRDDSLNLFIDHPGMGWHNVGEAGIDRRGINAAINALLVTGRRALADLEESAGNHQAAAELRKLADDLAGKVGRLFIGADHVFHDGRLNGDLLPQVSEQTNTWAIAAGCCDSATGKQILANLLTVSDANVARNGPYFWTYLFPLLTEYNLPSIALEKIRREWGRMVDEGATTLWETFKGDHLDSWCHPWSAAALEYLLTGILGLPDACRQGQSITLRPRFDVLSEASGQINTAAGPISINWKRTPAGGTQLQGSLPSGVNATLMTPDGKRHPLTSGSWSFSA